MRHIIKLCFFVVLTIIVPKAYSVAGNYYYYYSEGLRFWNNGFYGKAASQFRAAMICDDAKPAGQTMYKLSLYCDTHIVAADSLFKKRNFGDAYVHYDIVAQNNPSDLRCREQMGSCLKKQRNVYDGMVLVSGGSFSMGRKDGPLNERPQRVVRITSFYMDKYEVTNEEYARFINIKGLEALKGGFRINLDNPDCKLDTVNGYCIVKPGYEKYPVVAVSWEGTQDYAVWVGKSLPTEAQFEYAFADSKATAVDNILHPVGFGQPNQFGVYNLCGNVAEWCQEWYHDNAYTMTYGSKTNPTVNQISEYRSVRGASFDDLADNNINPKTFRDFNVPAGFHSNIGFRCVCNEVME
ncbi:MAG: formylglycine-generating enzyme family protein [Bacteroidales bacterium]|nr:formylglycine-generating enzyme family protein [Bacteroidales bacterium]